MRNPPEHCSENRWWVRHLLSLSPPPWPPITLLQGKGTAPPPWLEGETQRTAVPGTPVAFPEVVSSGKELEQWIPVAPSLPSFWNHGVFCTATALFNSSFFTSQKLGPRAALWASWNSRERDAGTGLRVGEDPLWSAGWEIIPMGLLLRQPQVTSHRPI